MSSTNNLQIGEVEETGRKKGGKSIPRGRVGGQTERDCHDGVSFSMVDF